MIKPKRLKEGDKVAVVSLSWGGLGNNAFIHKYHIAKQRLEEEFGLSVVAMPHALKGTQFVSTHPELRALDLMEAFKDDSISAIFCAIGGDDTIRLLPYIDYDVIKSHPKIFMGYSDSTVNHFMMMKAGLVSFYGPTVMAEFGEYVDMFEYTKNAVKALLFADSKGYRMDPSTAWCDEFVPWDEANTRVLKKLKPETHGLELLQGQGKVSGHLLGGCLDVFTMCIGTDVWPSLDEWRGAILFIETSEEKISPELVKWILRNLAAQGILKAINGMIVGKPMGEVYYEEYKAVIMQVVAEEEGLGNLPIMYNVNFGHAAPIGVVPCGIVAEIDAERKSMTLVESATV